MDRLSTFFEGGETRLGVFYPTHHLVALFPNLQAADTAKRELQKAGLLDEEVISASGSEVMQFAKKQAVDAGLWGFFMSNLSRAIGTEAAYSDDDLAAARSGAGFIFVHCPTIPFKDTAWKSLAMQYPVSARYYGFGGIEHLAGEN